MTMVLETVVRHAPFGLRVWDPVTATHDLPSLRVRLRRQGRSFPTVEARSNRIGIYHASGLPGIAAAELADDPMQQGQRSFRVDVDDPEGRFLPFGFDADLPHRGLYSDAASQSLLTVASAANATSPPGPAASGVPVFSAPTRQMSEPIATIRADLISASTGLPVSWCLVVAEVDGHVRGAGLSDRNGRLVILFPYPVRRRPPISSPPQPNTEFQWQVTLKAYPPLAGAYSPDAADLKTLAAQLARPPTRLLLQQGQPATPLPPQPLDFRMPLIVRSIAANGSPLPHVLVETP